MNVLQKLMFWRKRDEAEPQASLPESGPNDPATIGSRPDTPDESEYREERQRKLLEEHERKVEKGEPPDYQV